MKAWIAILCILAGVILEGSSHECVGHKVEDSNKQLVLSFYQELLGDKNVSSIDKYIDQNTFIQHNPEVADGRDGLKEAVKIWTEGKVWFQEHNVDIQHVGADGDLVFLHVKTVREGKITSLMAIFKLKDGKIIEHWDVYQQLPNKPKNDHPLF